MLQPAVRQKEEDSGGKNSRYSRIVFKRGNTLPLEWPSHIFNFGSQAFCPGILGVLNCATGYCDPSSPISPWPPPPRFHEAENMLWLAEGEAVSRGSTPASSVTAVAEPGVPCVATIITASPLCRSAICTVGVRCSIWERSPPRWPGPPPAPPCLDE